MGWVARRLSRIRRSELGRDTLWMLAANGFRAVAQGIVLILITRLLGVSGFGAFAGALAMVGMATPFAGFGGAQLLVREVARDRERLPEMWRATLQVAALSGSILCALLLLAAVVILPDSIPLSIVGWIALSDLLLGGFLTASWMAYQAVGRLDRSAQLSLLPGLLKVGGVLGLVFARPQAGPTAVAAVYGLSTAIATVVSLALVRLELYRPGGAQERRRPYPVGEAFHFCAGHAAHKVYNDLDKFMLARLATLEATGVYAAAYRVIEMAYLPLLSMFSAAYARFFREGAAGLRGSLALARRLMPAGVGYAAGASVLIYISAPVIPLVIGGDYDATVAAVRWLAIAPVIHVIHHFAADILTGAGYQAIRTRVQLGVAGGNFLLNLWLIPAYGWLGAAWATLACEGALLVGMWTTVKLIAAREARSGYPGGEVLSTRVAAP